MPMPPPEAQRGPRAALQAALVGLLLPGALAAQQPFSVSVPSLDDAHRATPPARTARHAPTAHFDHGRFRTLRMSDTEIRDVLDPGLGVGRPGPALTRLAAAASPTVLDAVFALAGPAKERKDDDEAASLGSLGDVLPRALTRDLLELRARIREFRTVLFGPRGIVRWGTVDGDDRRGRIRLNLQADPHPGLRVTLITR